MAARFLDRRHRGALVIEIEGPMSPAEAVRVLKAIAAGQKLDGIFAAGGPTDTVKLRATGDAFDYTLIFDAEGIFAERLLCSGEEVFSTADPMHDIWHRWMVPQPTFDTDDASPILSWIPDERAEAVRQSLATTATVPDPRASDL